VAQLGTSEYSERSARMKLDVELYGARQVVQLLAKVEPDFAREVRADLRIIGQDVVEDARSLIPKSAMSGWTSTPPSRANRNRVRSGGFPPYDRQAMAGGMAVGGLFQRAQGSIGRSIVTVKSTNPAAQIYERAGVRKYVKTPTGDQFIDNIERQNRKQLRLLGTAAYRNRDSSRARILKLLESSKQDLQESLDRLGQTRQQGR